MGDTPRLPGPDFLHPTIAAKAFLDILHKVDAEVRGEMTMPSDSHDRLITVNTMNNVLDRLEAAVQRHIQGIERQMRLKTGRTRKWEMEADNAGTTDRTGGAERLREVNDSGGFAGGDAGSG